jgi:poly(hydroxyalkanoate) depolymerase family esterase
MARRTWTSIWTRSVKRSLATLRRSALRTPAPSPRRKPRPVAVKSVTRKPLAPTPGARGTPADGHWAPGLAVGPSGARRYRLFRPDGIASAERVPLLVMLHGCGQDAARFAASTRMNRIALRERFMVLYPEQERLANAQGCWNWFDTASGRAQGEVALIMAAIDQVCVLYPVDRARVAVAGLSAGASMAALLATRHPGRFRAVVMHSGVPPGAAHSSLSALGAMRGRRAAGSLPSGELDASAPALPPLLVIHGHRDAVVAPRNGRAAAQQWADAAGASAGVAREVRRGQRHPMTVTDYRARGRIVATLVDVSQLGHAWSGGAVSEAFGDARGPDASRMVWAFVEKQFRA